MGWKGWAKRGGGLVGALVLAIGAGACGGDEEAQPEATATTAHDRRAAGSARSRPTCSSTRSACRAR